MTYPATTDVLRTDTFDSWASKTNQNRASLIYTQTKLGDLSGLNTVSDNIVSAVNELKTTVDNSGSIVGSLTSIDAAVRGTDIATSIEKVYTTLNITLSDEIDNDISDAMTTLRQEITTNVNNLNISIGATDTASTANTTLINAMISSLGLNANGTLVDGGAFANASNVATENFNQNTIIEALDKQITNINTQLGIIGSNVDDGDASTSANATAIAGKISASDVLSGNSHITTSVDSNTVTLTHTLQTANPTTTGLSEQTVINRISTDAAGHVSNISTRELGNMSTKNQYISSAPPSSSDGANGDVWYRI